ncbi:hypothetical protein AQI88_28280 [Streptomyces cellostaticus]|uniref:Transcriptional regulator n=1 Tax=Streptomyces cellostaticus TaxID=67285 RepID=A0A101NH94_9ACTN|nr:hypothetical protein [Streptomyces cellostaticus]KUM93150.1 hypothetical protein AQI88_28280 [Streptomyces cellostaticus]
MPKGQPNEGLARLLDEADWTYRQLSAAVNRIGAERGLLLTYDESSVKHWLNGAMPRRNVRPVIVEALARRIGRPITLEEAGLGASPAMTGLEVAAPEHDLNTIEGLLDTGRADMDPSRRAVLTTALYSATLAVPGFGEADETLDRLEHQAAGRTVRIGPGDVAVVRSMTDKIADILDELGGAHARPMAAAFIVNSVASYLRADGPEAVKNDMRAAASDLVYLTGWMAMYERAHGLGQRYYRQALGLAKAANDQVTYCRTLRGMALQAANLRHANKALELADSAAEAAPSAGPRLLAFLRGQQAHGAALVGDQQLAFSRLTETEAALSRADNRRDAIGGYDQAAYFFHQSAVLYALGDVPGSITAMKASNRVRPPMEKQGNAHANGLLAQRQFEVGHIEAACATWNVFLDDYAALSSSRADEHFEIMRRRIRPYLKNARVRELNERAREMARQKAAA